MLGKRKTGGSGDRERGIRRRDDEVPRSSRDGELRAASFLL